MTDEKTKTVTVEMDGDTIDCLAALMPACTLWARSCGAPAPGLGDVISLAIRVLAAQVAEGSAELIGGPATTRH